MTRITNELLAQKANDVDNYVRQLRGHFHENPEVTGQEHKTSAYLQAEVRKLGLPVE